MTCRRPILSLCSQRHANVSDGSSRFPVSVFNPPVLSRDYPQPGPFVPYRGAPDTPTTDSTRDVRAEVADSCPKTVGSFVENEVAVLGPVGPSPRHLRWRRLDVATMSMHYSGKRACSRWRNAHLSNAGTGHSLQKCAVRRQTEEDALSNARTVQAPSQVLVPHFREYTSSEMGRGGSVCLGH